MIGIKKLANPNPLYLKFLKFSLIFVDDLSIALLIFSLGIFADLAVWIADLNLAFISGFLSPNLAATVISLAPFGALVPALAESALVRLSIQLLVPNAAALVLSKLLAAVATFAFAVALVTP